MHPVQVFTCTHPFMYELCDISNFNAVTGKHFPEIIAAIDANFAPDNYNLGYVAESSPISCWFDLTLSFEHYDFGMPTATLGFRKISVPLGRGAPSAIIVRVMLVFLFRGGVLCSSLKWIFEVDPLRMAIG